jgi:hypothetical protein
VYWATTKILGAFHNKSLASSVVQHRPTAFLWVEVVGGWNSVTGLKEGTEKSKNA